MGHEPLRPFREILTERRISLGLTQQDLAIRMYTSQSHISNLEAGRVDARLSTYIRWAHALEAKILVQLIEDTASVELVL